MNGQMTIFEFLPQETDFFTIPESEVMEIISQRIGVRLKWDDYLEGYLAKVGKLTITAGIDTYVCTHEGSEMVIENHKFIGAGWAKSTCGGSKPCNSIDEAVEYLQNVLKRYRGTQNEKDYQRSWRRKNERIDTVKP